MFVFTQAQTDSLLKTHNGYHFFHISDTANHKAIVFLHGGVRNPIFTEQYEQITINYLLEDNTPVLDRITDNHNHFDLILPITKDSLNWLDYPDKSFLIIKAYLDSLSKTYNEIYISGFSDGGTGSYKMFYNHSSYFDGLLVFNGYPQHSNFYKTVDYSLVTDKKVIFVSTFKDKVIPYEFLMVEYCKQKMHNPNTYFMVCRGDHSFRSYLEFDFQDFLFILNDNITNSKVEPIQGYVRNDSVKWVYPFRKKILKRYSFGHDTYTANKRQLRLYKEKVRRK